MVGVQQQRKGVLWVVLGVVFHLTLAHAQITVYVDPPSIIEQQEERPVGYEIATATVFHGLDGPVTGAYFGLETNQDAHFFSINSSTGVISLAEQIDTDVPDAKAQYNIVVNVTYNGILGESPVSITLADINDNTPHFNQTQYEVSLPEASPVGFEVFKAFASDIDQVQSEEVFDEENEISLGYHYTITNGLVTYSILEGNEGDQFKINQSTGVITIVPGSSIDVDTVNFYNLTLQAKDGGNLSNTTQLLVTILDSNDNAPVILYPDNFLINISENVIPDDNVIIDYINATDDDHGNNSEIYFAIIKGDVTDSFEIDSQTGLVTMIGELDREVMNPLQLVIAAIDRGEPSLQDTIVVTIYITDINDEPPIFSNSVYNFIVPEESNINIEVGTVIAVDHDQGGGGIVSYYFSEPSNDFKIHNTTGVISTARYGLDRETIPKYTLTVIAIDNPDNKSMTLNGSAIVIIQLSDINDNSPIWNQSEYSVGILENEPLGYQLINLTATDADIGIYGQVQYEFKTPQDMVFSIDSVTGVVTLNEEDKLDIHTKQNYTYSIRATDGGSRSSLTTLIIYVHAPNQNQPFFVVRNQNFTISENTSVGAIVVNVTATDKDPGLIGEVRYRIAEWTEFDGSGSFDVDMYTGAVFVNKSLDYDYKSSKYIFFQVEAYDGGFPEPYTDLTNITVYLTNVNDEFAKIIIPFKDTPTILENLPPYVEFANLSRFTIDEDPGDGGLFEFELLQIYGDIDYEDDSFNLTDDGVLTALRTFDREENPQGFILSVQTTDFGYPFLTLVNNVTVLIGDENDEEPFFEPNTTSVQVYELRLPGMVVIDDFTATDYDIGINAELDYMIVDGDTTNSFTVDSNGTIFTAKPLNKTEERYYTLTIKVVDKGLPPLHGYGEVFVEVLDINDNAPVFNEPLIASFNENDQPGTVFYRLNATDTDEDVNSYIIYYLSVETISNYTYFDNQTNSTIARFLVNETTGEVSINDVFDRETESEIRLVVVAVDMGVVPGTLNTSATLTVLLEDYNDHTPEFLNDSYIFSVIENESLTTPIGQVHAEDNDASAPNNEFSFHLNTTWGNDNVSINSTTGILYVSGILDWETASVINVTVYVEDHGVPPLVNTVSVTIMIEDVNDRAPEWIDSSLSLDIQENLPVGSLAGFIQAIDPDSFGNNSLIHYAIVTDDILEMDYFEVNSTTGEVSSLITFNRETLDMYNVTVVAYDSGSPQQSSVATLMIDILDYNDYKPYFSEPIYSATVSENIPVGEIITVLQASDQDVGKNAELNFSIPSSHYSYFFSIDEKTGELASNVVLDYETISYFEFQVIVTDNGLPQRNDTALVKITLTNYNDESPKFIESSYNISFVENIPIGSNLLRVQATDVDSEVISYSLQTTNGSAYFDIDTTIGMLYTVDFINREVLGSNVRLTVIANNSADMINPLSNSVFVYIKILDLNDQPPQLDYIIPVLIPEDTASGSVLYTLMAEDGDEGLNGTIVYDTAIANDDGLFTVNRTTGEITLNGSFDYETKVYHYIGVNVTDMGLVPLTGHGTVVLQVTDVNDNAPVFMASMYQVSIRSTADNPSDIVRVYAFDRDIDDTIEYSIISGNHNNLFSISSTTGQISAIAALESYPDLTVNLTVQASDGLSMDTAVVSIHIVDGDSPPLLFNSLNFSTSVTEGESESNLFTFFSEVAFPHASNHFFIIEGNSNNAFTLASTGELSVDGSKVDYETQSIYQLTVSVNSVSYCVITISVNDSNDFEPVFSSTTFHAPVYETIAPNQPFYIIHAQDEDGSSPNNEVTYAIVSGNDDGVFGIDTNTGELSLNQRLDYDLDQHSYTLTISAQNQASTPTHQTNTTVTIELLNGNRHAPVITQYPFITSTHENEPVGSVLSVVQAFDKDNNQSSMVTYTLLGNHRHYDVDINGTTGVITVGAGGFDYERQTEYSIIVVVSDDEVPTMTSTTIVPFSILDVNDNSPVWEHQEYSVSIPENTGISGEILAMLATDADHISYDHILDKFDISNGLVTYSITAGDPKNQFTVTENTFQHVSLDIPTNLSAISALDREDISEYNITVTATDGGGRSADTYVHITLIDVNDVTPTFNDTTLFISVSEHTDVGSLITSVPAVDTDLLDNSLLVYSIINGNVNDTFSINNATAEVYLEKELDREYIDLYSLTIEAVDNGVPRLTGSTVLNITVIDENEYPPVFSKPLYSSSISEDIDFDVVIVQVIATDQDTGVNSDIVYSIANSTVEDQFKINYTTGEITINMELDYEVHTYHELVVIAEDSAHSSMRMNSTVIVTISVSDVNDNPPIFDQNLYTASIYEDDQPFSDILQVMADDIDSSNNGEIRYSLVFNNSDTNAENNFEIDEFEGNITLSAAPALDYEDRQSYHFYAVASDMGIPALSTTVLVSIDVLDVNDNIPMFENAVYKGSVMENLLPGQELLSVNATDEDSNENGEIVYSLKEVVIDSDSCMLLCHHPDAHDECNTLNELNTTSSSLNDQFTIDSVNGKLTTNSSFDRELISNYAVVVTATDSSIYNEQLSSDSCVFVAILDDNDNVPVFLNLPNAVSIFEEQHSGVLVFNVTATDLDIGNNSLITYELADSSGDFTIDPVTGQVYTISSLDRESVSEYNITITAKDNNGGVDTNTNTSQLVVTVLDINDSPPVFEETFYNVSITEDSPEETLAISVTANDLDIGENGVVRYQISSIIPRADFYINETTGDIHVWNILDRESYTEYSILIIATDGGTPPLESNTTVNTAIIDVNDNPPMLSQSLYSVEVDEGLVPVSPILTSLVYFDQDIGINHEVQFSLIGHEDIFTINTTSGEVYMTQSIDYESDQQLNLTIVVANTYSTPALSTTAVLIVTINDINDNPPIFTSSNYYGIVPESRPVGYPVLTVEATDADGTVQNRNLTYSIINSTDLFEIHPKTGQIIVNKSLDSDSSPPQYIITVYCEDSGGLSDTTLVTITLTNVNDNPPMFVKGSYSFDFPENEPIGVSIGSVHAMDADNDSLSYYISQDKVYSDEFTVNAQTGEIFSNFSFDRESQDQYMLTVTVVDDPVNGSHVNVTVYINITDLNDNSPEFQPNSYTIFFKESTDIDSHLLTITTFDSDLGLNAVPVYSIESGHLSSYFYLNSSTGDVYLNKSLDREDISMISITLVATDQLDHTLSSTATLTLHVLDVNDNSPIFSHSVYNATISENAANGTIITTDILATDADIDENGYVSYSLANEFKNLFYINSSTGVVTLISTLNYESAHNYTVTIYATDHGIPPLQTTSELFVKLDDVNDNSPYFEESSYSVSVPENSVLGTSVFAVPAIDIDDGLNGKLQYTILSGNVGFNFQLDEDTGLISVADSIDYETEKDFILEIQVVDMGIPQYTATTTVDVMIEDVNDNPPVFTQVIYHASVPEDSASGFIISTDVLATDVDSGSNGDIRYSIVPEGNGNNTFSINEETGHVLVNRELEYSTKSSYSLTVMASDKGIPSLTSICQLMVTVTDVNEYAPVIYSSNYYLNVSQFTAIGTTLAHLSTHDPDSMLVLPSYTVTANTDSFDITLNGELYVNSTLATGQYTATITITDGQHETSVTLGITVYGILYTGSTFDLSTYLFTIPEDISLGNSVGTVTVDGGFDSIRFISPEGDPIQATDEFTISSSGTVTTVLALDHETEPYYVMNVRIAQGTNELYTIVTVRVTDVNDNPPVFDNDQYSITLSEWAQLDKHVLQLTTTDPDSPGINTDTTLSITQGGEYFNIDPVTNTLVLIHAIDRESTDQVSVIVVANNTKADVIQYSTTQVVVTVEDENDNSPVFDQANYYTYVFDSTPVGHSILTLSATDSDTGLNSQLVYSISHQSSPGSFVINQTSGVIRTSKIFKDLVGSTIEVSVSVSDMGVPTPRTSSAPVIISVINTNLHHPEFTEPEGYGVAIEETVGIGTLVIEVEATDTDNDSVYYSIMTDNVPFEIEPLTGVVTVSGELDYLTRNYYSIVVAATDDGVPEKSSQSFVNVSVIDINTHSPVFTQDEYQKNIIEDVTVGSFIIQVNAFDLDAVSIQYVITLNYPESGTKWFRINDTTGEIYIDSPVDRELNEQVTLLVSAIDTGYSIQRSTSVNVIINITDVNDEDPVFTKSPYAVDVIRLTPPNYPVLQVVANDPDVSSTFIQYSIEYQTVEGIFTIDPDSGEITTSSMVPEDVTNNTVIIVSAFDGGQKSNVTVNVKAATDGTFCVDGFCTDMKERDVDCILFGTVCTPKCSNDEYLSPLDWLCVSHHCENNSLVTCAAEEKCVLPNQICNGNCPHPLTQSKCRSTDLCYDSSMTTPCDINTCLTDQTLVQSTNGVRTCNTSSTLPLNGQDCETLGYVYCTETDSCSNLTTPQLCSYCPDGLTPCEDTKVCVNHTKYCCGVNGYYCEVLDACVMNGLQCKLPNIAPKVTEELVYHSTVAEVGQGMAVMVGVLLGNSSHPLGVDSQNEEVGIAIVEVAPSDTTLGVWQYAECESSDLDSCKQCNNMSSWTTIADGLSQSHSLFLSNTACLRYSRNSLKNVNASWLRVKLWDGNTDGYISPGQMLVRDQSPFYGSTVPYTDTGSTSEASTLLTVLITPINSQPVFGVSEPRLAEIIENVKLQDNIGDSVEDIVGEVSFEPLPVLESGTVIGLPESDGFGNTIQYTSYLPADALEAFYSAITKVNPTRTARLSSDFEPSIAIQILTSDLVNGDWQVSVNGDPQLYTYLTDIVGITNQLILLSGSSRIRFIPKPYFSGVAMLAVYAWDGVLPQSVQEQTLNDIVIHTGAHNTFLPQSLNSVYYLKIDATQVEQQPVITNPSASLSPIPYSIKFTYTSLFTITVTKSFNDLEASVVDTALKLTDLGNSFTIHNMLPAANDRSYVMFSIHGNALNKSQIQNIFYSEENLDSVLPIEELNQYANYGGNIACDASVTEGEIHGDLVNSLISGVAVDNDDDYLGVAVIGINGLEQGVWQYSRGNWSDGTTSGVWFNLPSNVTHHSAILLHGNDRIRYIPRANYYWTTESSPSITVKAWDNSLNTITEYSHSEQVLRNINTDPYSDTLQSIHKPRGRFSTNTVTIRASRIGCDKVSNSGLQYDACCVCGGSGEGCAGCDSVEGSNTQLDSCGECNGGDASCVGCDGVPYSFVTPGPCSECVSSGDYEWSQFNETFRDCMGLCHGQAMVDDCGVCSGELNGHEYNSSIDCHGICFGKNVLDDCQYCTGPDTGLSFNQYLDCTGVCDGPFRSDSCDVCQLPDEHGTVIEHRDCNGVCHGTAQRDSCGICYGGTTGIVENSVLDLCGVCNGNSTTCDGCDGVRNSGLTVDNCGVCGGNNCGCQTLTSVSPSKGSGNGGTQIVITGAGFFVNTSSYNPNLSYCNVSKDESISAHCRFQIQNEGRIVTALIVDQNTIICDTPTGIINKVELFTLRVEIENQPIQPLLSFLFQSYDDINIATSTPSMALINHDNITVTFTGDGFIDNGEQMKCLMKDDSTGCLSHLPVDSKGYHSVMAEFVSSTTITCLMPVSSVPCEVSLYLSLDGQQSGIIPYKVPNSETFVYAFSPPIVTTAHFTDSLDTLVIQFDRSVSVQGQLTCAVLFSTELLKLIGDGSSCTWGNTQRSFIHVQLAADSSITAGTLIQFKEGTVVTADKDFSFSVSEILQIHPPMHPVVVLEGPSTIPSCGSVRFTAVNSYYEGYGNFDYKWSIYTLDATVSGVKDIAKYTNSLTSSQSSIELPSNLFQSNTEYVVQVEVTNAMGMSSRSSKELMKESVPSLQVSVSSPEYQTVRADQEVLLQANIVNSDCTDMIEFEFDWTVSKLTNERRSTYEAQTLPAGVVMDTALLYIPGGSLIPASKYKVSLTVTSSSQTNTQTMYITVKDIECQAIVSGGNRTVPVGQQLILDGSMSIEPTSSVPASYIWQCSLYTDGTPCYDASLMNSFEVITLPSQKQVSLSTSKLHPGIDYLFTLTLSQGADCESRFDTVITIVPPTNPPAVVEILTTPLTQLSPSHKVIIEGLVLPSEPVDIIWECLQLPDHSYIDLSSDVLLSSNQYTSVLESEISSHSDHVVQDRANTVNLVLMPGVLNDTLPYSFQLTAYSRTDATRNASVSVTIFPRIPPRIDLFTISPSSGTEASTVFELHVEMVIADVDHYPLLYQYGVVNGHSVQWLSGLVNERIFNTQLPSGSPTTVIVRVYDNIGGYSESLMNVKVGSTSSVSLSLEGVRNSLSASRDWITAVSSLQTLLLSMEDEISLSIQSDVVSLYSTLFNQYIPKTKVNLITVLSLADLIATKSPNMAYDNRMILIDTIIKTFATLEEFAKVNFNDIHSSINPIPQGLSNNRYGNYHFNEAIESLYIERVFRIISTLTSGSRGVIIAKELQAREALHNLLCMQTMLGEYPVTLMSDESTFLFFKGIPVGTIIIGSNASLDYVELDKHTFVQLYNKLTCPDSAKKACSETCTQLMILKNYLANDYVDISVTSQDLIYQNHPFTDPQQITIVSEILSFDISIPTDSNDDERGYINVEDNILISAHFHVTVSSIANDSTLLCMYSGSSVSTYTGEWHIQSAAPVLVTDRAGTDVQEFSCTYTHLSQFAIGVLPPPVPIVPSSSVFISPSPSPVRTTTSSEVISLSRSPVIVDVSRPFPVAGTVSGVLVGLIVAIIVIIVHLIAIRVIIKRMSKVHPLDKESAVEQTHLTHSAESLAPSEQPPIEVPSIHLGVIQLPVNPEGERFTVGNLDVPQPSRLRELRNLLYENFPQLKKIPFYLCSAELNDIPPETEQQSFVRLVYSNIVYIREAKKNQPRTKKEFCVCGKVAEMECSRCKLQGYCSSECQSKDWEEKHRTHCNSQAEKISRANVLQRIASRGSVDSERKISMEGLPPIQQPSSQPAMQQTDAEDSLVRESLDTKPQMLLPSTSSPRQPSRSLLPSGGPLRPPPLPSIPQSPPSLSQLRKPSLPLGPISPPTGRTSVPLSPSQFPVLPRQQSLLQQQQQKEQIFSPVQKPVARPSQVLFTKPPLLSSPGHVVPPSRPSIIAPGPPQAALHHRISVQSVQSNDFAIESQTSPRREPTLNEESTDSSSSSDNEDDGNSSQASKPPSLSVRRRTSSRIHSSDGHDQDDDDQTSSSATSNESSSDEDAD